MKNILVLCLLFLGCYSTLIAQEKSGVKSAIGAASSKKENLGLNLTKPVNGVSKTFTISSMSILVGMPYMGLIKGATDNIASTQNYSKDLGFPWGIRYLNNTFAEDAFTISKGYFSDRIEINWAIKKNQGKISSLIVYRTEDISSARPNWGKPLKTLAGDAGTFSDTNTEGGKLYRYKIFAKGVEIEGLENLYSNYIIGIGYRNPTGIVTGNISYTGGNPVKDVLISANPTGSSFRFGSSLKVPTNSSISVENLHEGLKDSITLQTWVRPETNFNNEELTLYNLLGSGAGESLVFKIKLGLLNGKNTLTATVGAEQITLTDYIPSGEIDNKGEDVLVPINTINSSFTHFSTVLRNNKIPEIYINGRLINAAYAAKMNTILAQDKSTASAKVTFTSNNRTVLLNNANNNPKWLSFKMGGGKTAFIDEIRVWETALSPSQIQRDYRRYLKGNESYFNTYIKANEKTGDYAYDLAHTGFDFHGNDIKLSHAQIPATWANSEDNVNNIPLNSQLGILGVTDEFGNYVISSIPYSGNGDAFTIVPSFGKHEFNPKQELAFLGAGSTVVNNVDFIDKSSFVFKGIAVYDSREVFPYTSDAAITGDIKEDEAYNAYTIGNLKYQKGEYWAEKDKNGTILRLRRYAAIPVPDAYVSIDNQPAIDANNVPIQTDINGRFTIEVPIGKHAISISKSGHTFDLEGRYPARTRKIVNKDTTYTNTYQDFFEDRDEPITFIDTTKVYVIGRVVGGTKEADKTLGFGFNGTKTYTYKDDANIDRSIVYTSTNNIGKARLTLGHLPAGATSVTPEYKTSFETNTQTGEYRVKLLPLNYILAQNDLTFTSGKNPDNKPLLSEGKTINFTAIKPLQYASFVQGNKTITGLPYQEILKFTHFATPIYTVLSQSSDSQIMADGKTYTIISNPITPIYSQFGNYSIQIQGQERYSNYDSNVSRPVISTVPVEGGEIIPTNNLALENSEKTVVSTTDPSILIYSFKGGIPNTDAASGYKRTIDLRYRLNGVDTPLENYKREGILLGGVADGTQTFVTAGPQVPDFVLRDPPGSESSATIEKGSSFSFSKESSISAKNSNEANVKLALGVEISVGGGLAGPVIKTETTNSLENGISMEQSSSDGSSVTNTYTFNQTISTSDDPSWIGSDADLYIGTSANQFYGTYNNLIASSAANGSSPIQVLPLAGVSRLYPKINKALYFNDAPEKTLFVYSQHNILNEIIPKYLDIIAQIDAGTLIPNRNGVLSKNAYLSSVNLWRKMILNNELSKYQALNDKDKLKTSLNSIIESLKDPLTNTLSNSAKELKNLLNATFYENISFDAGVGEFTKGFQVERLTSNSFTYTLDIDSELAYEFGQKVNETGLEVSGKSSIGTGIESSNEDSNDETTTVTYTLRDSDSGNTLSVDVINAFDGNGPIFITKGGETSCPNEGAELSYFYNPTHPNVTTTNASIINLTENLRKPLSIATSALEKPEITVVAADVAGIFEGRNAEFVLKLRNTSTISKDATFKLSVDQSSNPDNALINIEPNGTLINVPAGKTVLYTMTLKKVKQDQFDYKNIRVVFESTCDDNATDDVLVSANFVPACSPVSIMTPSNNWLLNRNTAFDDDAKTKPVNIKLGGYNTSFASFEKINLEYRLKGTPDWIGLRTYFKSQDDLNTAKVGGAKDVELIIGAELNYSWDIAALGLGNGSYELRARTSCYNKTAYESEIIEGKVDLVAPVLFGTPTPRNGILNLGDDISLRFNEPVKTNGTVTKFEFLVQKNQLPVKHEVSLAFNGVNNMASITKPAITTGDFSIEFWLKNMSPAGTSTLLSQNSGLKIELIDSELIYTIGGQTIRTPIARDTTFNYYALSYDATAKKLTIIENSTEKKSTTLTNSINFTNENPIVLGGNTFKGNLHDLRFWKKYITREAATINMNSEFSGNELGLIGYWPMNEGNGNIANDLARFKHLALANVDWDIFPKGTAYTFDGSNYLQLDSASKVIISKEMDATVSFWMKSGQTSIGTLLSNGWDNDNDLIESNGYRNKWSINLNLAGGIELKAENKTFSFGSKRVNDNSWHHIAMSLTRNGTVRMYVDGNETATFPSADIGGFSSSTIRLGAQSVKTVNQGTTTYPLVNYFNGQMDEISIWNMARTADQIKADRYFELDFSTTGLILYSNFNKPEIASDSGPKYYYPKNAFQKVSTNATLIKPVSYTEIGPGIKPFRPTESLVVQSVINGDQIIMNPEITNWASVEGKVAYITVSNLNDMADNRQASPITWTAFINKNPTKWFVDGHNDIVNLIKRTNENLSFDITIINRGGTTQSYSIELPSWLILTAKSGTIAPNTSLTLKATVDKDLAIGNYNTVLSLETNYGYHEKIQLDLRVLEKEPTLVLDPSKFSESMNIIGKVKLNGVFTDDLYDKVVVLVNNEVRGMTNIVFDPLFNEYFVYLTVYSNTTTSENMVFYIWDASDGKLKEALLNNLFSIPYVQDDLIGTYKNPAIFTNTDVTGQQIALNQGWSWTSFNVTDTRFANLNTLTQALVLKTSDLIQSNAPALFDAYQYDALNPTGNGWAGSISANGGISSNKMYKIKLEKGQNFNIKGIPVNLSTWFFDLNPNWNWLPYVVSKNIPVADALANFNASEGDLIKSQSSFAIYSESIGWKGSMTYLKAGEGYMLKSTIAQKFTYPEYLNRLNVKTVAANGLFKDDIKINESLEEKNLLSKEFSKFASTMNAIVKLPKGYQDLSFFNESGQLRGITKTMNVQGEDLAFITIYGDKLENLTAYIGSGNNAKASSKIISFSADAILGSISKPIIIELLENEISVFPNPFDKDFEILFNGEDLGDAKITVFNMFRQKVHESTFKVMEEAKLVKIQADILPGIYILQVQIGDKVITKKLIKN